MKKIVSILAMTLFVLQLSAQTSPEIAPPPVPLPPDPSAPTLKTLPVQPATPTVMPVPPQPPLVQPVVVPAPVPPAAVVVNDPPRLTTAPVYNDRGYNLSVVKVKGIDKVWIQDKSTKTYITLDSWNKRQEYYEKKYGTLPSLAPKN